MGFVFWDLSTRPRRVGIYVVAGSLLRLVRFHARRWLHGAGSVAGLMAARSVAATVQCDNDSLCRFRCDLEAARASARVAVCATLGRNRA